MFGPAPSPRQKADGTPWTVEETGTLHCHWMAVTYRTDRARLTQLLPPGFELRGEPHVTTHLSYFRNLYWLAGRSYGIAVVDFPVTYTGKKEVIAGNLCVAMFEGLADAVLTGREELGFPKLFADIPAPQVEVASGTASGQASWFGHRFLDISARELVETHENKGLPGPGGANLYLKYMPGTAPFGLASPDACYVTTSAPPAGSTGDASPIDFSRFEFRKWRGRGEVAWHRATFEQLPTTFHVVNGIQELAIREFVGAELVQFSGPGIGVSANGIRAVD